MKRNLVIGASDAITAHIYSRHRGVDFIWASSFIMSAMLGLKDDGVIRTEIFSPLIKALVTASACPVILDFDVGGKDIPQYRRNLHLINQLNIGGICIEDESWPKINAMLKNEKRRLISPSFMSKKIRMAKRILGTDSLVIARTHSFIISESDQKCQKRIDEYQKAGADALCIHYTGDDWLSYLKKIDALKINTPLFLILSRRDTLPRVLLSRPEFQYILYPNQLYRTMVYGIMPSGKEELITSGRCPFFKKKKTDVDVLFNIMNKING